MGGFEYQMEVVWHETEGKDLNRVASFSCCEKIKEGLVILAFMEDLRTTIASIGHVIGIASLLATWDPRHDGASNIMRARQQ